jgi:hypothetical protein
MPWANQNRDAIYLVERINFQKLFTALHREDYMMGAATSGTFRKWSNEVINY